MYVCLSMCLVILVGILHLLCLIKGTGELKYFKIWQGILLTRMCFTLAKKRNSGRPGELIFLHAVFRKQTYIFFWPEAKVFAYTLARTSGVISLISRFMFRFRSSIISGAGCRYCFPHHERN